MKITDLDTLITTVNNLTKAGKVQTAFRLISTVQLNGMDERILDRVFDKIEYSSLDRGFDDVNFNNDKPAHFVKDEPDGSYREITKQDIFDITRALRKNLLVALA